jgi:alpha-maltose-1-phosphate synthase
MMDAEESEYAEADCITVPSHFANRSFLSQGVVKAFALWRRPVEVRPHRVPTKGKFDILFAGVMSLRKGIHYVAEGSSSQDAELCWLAVRGDDHASASAKSMAGRCQVLGHVSQSQL